MSADIPALAADQAADPRRSFDDPMALADADAPYEARLRLLQRWRALAVREHGDGSDAAEAAQSALTALEGRAELEQDERGAPHPPTYGDVKREE
jgi:hypothetical protein